MTRMKPPKFTEKESYKDWKIMAKIWAGLTEHDNSNDMDLAALLMLNIDNKKAKKEIINKKDMINSPDHLFTVLDKLYINEIDPIGELFQKYREFDTIEREDDERIQTYIDRFVDLYKELEQGHKMKIPEEILCFKILEGARVDDHTKQLISSNCKEIKFNDVTEAFRKATGFLSAPAQKISAIKREPEDAVVDTLLTNTKQLVCYICGDKTHFQFQCPHNKCSYLYDHEENKYVWQNNNRDDRDNNRDDRNNNRDDYNTNNRRNQYRGNQNRGNHHRGQQNRGNQNRGYQNRGNHYQGNNRRNNYYGDGQDHVYYSNNNNGNHNYNDQQQQRYNNQQYHPNDQQQQHNNQRPNDQRSNDQRTNNNQPRHNQDVRYQDQNGGYDQGQQYNDRFRHNSGNNQNSGTNTNVMLVSEAEAIVCYYGSEQEMMNPLVKECINQALLDSGAGKTVCGELWVECYKEAIGQEIKTEDDNPAVWFRFGDGEPIKAERRILLPCNIGKRSMLIDTYVVAADIPLLISRESMGRAEMKIDYGSDQVEAWGEKLLTSLTSSGQFIIPILPVKEVVNHCGMVQKCALDLEGVDKTVKKKMALKLHRILSHATAEKVNQCVKDAGKDDPELREALVEVVKNCEVCQKIRKPPNKPKVSLPLSSRFNELVAMDLKFIEGKIVLHLIDTFTRYSQAAIIPNKEAVTVIDAIFAMWITYFGRPEKLFSDNGPEFNNNDFIDMCASYEIDVKVTPVEAPYSNGICERHNSVIAQMTKKTKMSTSCTWKVALMWAVNAKNNLHNIYGFTPQQLVMGRNTKLPSILDTENLATLNENTVNKLVTDNLNAMQTARQEFLKVERSIRLKRAMKSKVPSYNDAQLLAGDQVFYKRLKTKDYLGPGTVVGMVEKNVII